MQQHDALRVPIDSAPTRFLKLGGRGKQCLSASGALAKLSYYKGLGFRV